MLFGTAVAPEFTVIFYKFHRTPSRSTTDGFTLVEAVIAVSLIGIGVASTLGALTKFNSMAANSRNATGAYQVVMNQIDLFQSMSPFNPQKFTQDGVTPQIPKYTETGANVINPTYSWGQPPTNTPLPSYDVTLTTLGTRTIGFAHKDSDGITRVDPEWPVYQYMDPNTGRVVIVKGTLTIDVTDLNPGSTTVYMYKAVVTIGYQVKGGGPTWSAARNRWEYQLSMSTIRTSDI